MKGTDTAVASRPREAVVNLMPGPVSIHPDVHAAFAAPPVSHRGERFLADVHRVADRLCAMVRASRVEILLGSGTLANDAVAAQLGLLREPGLVLHNGEFGERLVEQARRFGLPFREMSAPWGLPLDFDAVGDALDRAPETGWLWSTHCETSTGVLNDLDRLRALCGHRGVKLVADCISSIGTVPVDLDGVYLATCVSGKALASYPGLSMVFHHHEIAPSEDLPRYLDLGHYARSQGVAFTTSSNLLYALDRSLDRFEGPGGNGVPQMNGHRQFGRTRELATWLRAESRDRGLEILAPDRDSSPAVITLRLHAPADSMRVGDELARRGFLLSYRSEYLVRRNLIQICLMGEQQRDRIAPLLDLLPDVARAGPAAPETAGRNTARN